MFILVYILETRLTEDMEVVVILLLNTFQILILVLDLSYVEALREGGNDFSIKNHEKNIFEKLIFIFGEL